MEGTFNLTLDGQVVGTVKLKREGLYCRVSCCCRVAGKEIRRLYADGEKLGVLIPEHGELILETKVAAKRLKPGCAFSLDQNTNTFIPIRPGEAFEHLDKLRPGRLTFREGEMGLMV